MKKITTNSIFAAILLLFVCSPAFSQPVKVWESTTTSEYQCNNIIALNSDKNITLCSSLDYSIFKKMDGQTIVSVDTIAHRRSDPSMMAKSTSAGYAAIFSKENVPYATSLNIYRDDGIVASSIGLAKLVNNNSYLTTPSQIIYNNGNYYISGYYVEPNYRTGFVLCVSGSGELLGKYTTSRSLINNDFDANAYKILPFSNGIYFITNEGDGFNVLNLTDRCVLQNQTSVGLKNLPYINGPSFFACISNDKLKLIMVSHAGPNDSIFVCQMVENEYQVSQFILPINGITNLRLMDNDTFLVLYNNNNNGVGLSLLKMTPFQAKIVWKYQVTEIGYTAVDFDVYDKNIYIASYKQETMVQNRITKIYYPDLPSVTSGLNDVHLFESINIYPNPVISGNRVNIDMDPSFCYQIFDSKGSIVYNNDFFPGIYFVRIMAPSGATIIKKIVVQ
jgi:hypothetical protein